MGEQGPCIYEFGAYRLAELGNIGQIVVRPTSMVRAYAASGTDLVVAGRTLGVDAVLAGNIQRSGEHLRLTVQLVLVADGSSIRSDRFDVPWTDVFRF